MTFVWRDMLSSGKTFSLEVTCMMAVKYDIGLNKYEMHRDFGVSRSLDHFYSWAHLSKSSLNHRVKFFLEG